MTTFTTGSDLRIAAAAALTAGTRTLETSALAIMAGSSTGVGTGLAPSLLLAHDASDYPIVLAANEGIVINNLIAMGAVGVINLFVNVEFAEMSSF